MAVTLSAFALRKDFQCRSFAERTTTIAAPDGESDGHQAAARAAGKIQRFTNTSIFSNGRFGLFPGQHNLVEIPLPVMQ